MTFQQKHLSVASWNIHGLGDKYMDPSFIENIKSDINVILETWKGESADTQINGFVSISKSRKKNKRSKRHSGGIIVYIKKQIYPGIEYLKDGSQSPNRMWLKLNKTFFGTGTHIYLCAVYIPPLNSTHTADDLLNLEAEIANYSKYGDIALIGDFNARTGEQADYIENENNSIQFLQDMLPQDYDLDSPIKRNNLDILNQQGNNLLNMCLSSRLRILNGRYLGDSLGYHTYFSKNGCSTVDYAILSKDQDPTLSRIFLYLL